MPRGRPTTVGGVSRSRCSRSMFVALDVGCGGRWFIEERVGSRGCVEAEEFHAHEGEADVLRVRLLDACWRPELDRRAGIDGYRA